MSSQFLGIFVNPAHFQSEGINAVLDNLQRAGAQAVTFVPFVEQPTNRDEGNRFPDLHIDGYRRILARPVWGKTELYLKKTLAFRPNETLYQETPYRPVFVEGLLDQGFSPSSLIAEAKKRGLKVYLQLHPYLPPHLKEDDKPVFIDGSLPGRPRVANNATLTSPAAQAYALALIEDTLTHYPTVDGLYLDWAEFGAYQLQDHFACFSEHSQRAASNMDFDWGRIRHDVSALWRHLHQLDGNGLRHIVDVVNSPSAMLELLSHYPGWVDFIKFKAQVVHDAFQQIRDLLDGMELRHIDLCARGWGPPWNRSSGMDYRLLSKVCSIVSPKLFLFDYSAMPRWYGQTLVDWNRGLAESDVLDVVIAAMNLADDRQNRRFADYNIPHPDQSHVVRFEVYEQRLREVRGQLEGEAHFYPFAHAYLPTTQFREMVHIVKRHADGMWLQMYGYLSDEKLHSLSHIWV